MIKTISLIIRRRIICRRIRKLPREMMIIMSLRYGVNGAPMTSIAETSNILGINKSMVWVQEQRGLNRIGATSRNDLLQTLGKKPIKGSNK